MKQRSQEWFEARIGRFTASEIYKLFVNPRTNKAKEAGELSVTAYQYCFEKAVEYITGHSKTFTSKYTDHGIEWEDHARKLYESIAKLDVYECEFFPIGDYAGATPDGLVGESGILELKCPYNTDVHFSYLKLRTGSDLMNLKKEYYHQIQMQLLATERQWCDFVTYSPYASPYNLGKLRIYRDEKVISEMEARIKNALVVRNDIIIELESIKCFEDTEAEMLIPAGDYNDIIDIINRN